jgi:hypothetical protein
MKHLLTALLCVALALYSPGSIVVYDHISSTPPAPPPGSDEYFANVVLSLHCDGTNGSTTIVDSSSSAKTATVLGSAQISTAQQKFGTASLSHTSDNSAITFADHADFEFGTGNFTIEAFVRWSSASGFAGILTKRGLSAVGPYMLWKNGTTLYAFLSSNGSTWNIANGVTVGTIAANTWHHVALVRNGTTFTAYLDGVGTVVATSSAALVDNGQPFATSDTRPSEWFNGFMDEARITKGVARYTINFTPPTGPHSDS